jgi:hypothetical protein
MKLHHTAALALVGWYLMCPPSKGPNPRGGEVFSRAPLWDWEQVAVFDTAKECSDARSRDVTEMSQSVAIIKEQVPAPTAQRLREVNNMWIQIDLEQCIASDDPRLKEK